MEALVVGAGAVGQVLASHLQRSGARVSFLVKPKHAEATRRGFRLTSLNGKRLSTEFKPDGVLSAPSEAAANKWDLVVLCVSSTALRSGPWLDELTAATGDALYVAMQPGLEDPPYVAARVGRQRLVWFMFPLIAFPSDGGTTVYRPPLGTLPFSGARAKEIVSVLRKGGLPSRVHPDVSVALAFSGPLLEVLVIALELVGWRMAAIGPELAPALAAMREALAVSGRLYSQRVPLLMKLVRPWMLRLALPVAVRLAPFGVEEYLRKHFTKVGDQTAAGMATFIRLAGQYGLPATAMSASQERLLQKRSAA